MHALVNFFSYLYNFLPGSYIFIIRGQIIELKALSSNLWFQTNIVSKRIICNCYFITWYRNDMLNSKIKRYIFTSLKRLSQKCNIFRHFINMLHTSIFNLTCNYAYVGLVLDKSSVLPNTSYARNTYYST